MTREQADLGLRPAVRRSQPADHGERAQVVADHVLEEEAVELTALSGREPGDLPGADHPWHKPCSGAMARSVVLGVRRLLVASDEPPLHRLDLGLLRDLRAPGEQRDVSAGAPLAHEARHQERLGVVMDHPLHEIHVSLLVGRGFDVPNLVLGQTGRRLARGTGLNDVGLPDTAPLRVVGVARAAAEQHHCHEREQRPARPPAGGAVFTNHAEFHIPIGGGRTTPVWP